MATISRHPRSLSALLALLVLAVAMAVAAAGAGAEASYEVEPEAGKPTRAECEPGQPYNRQCPTIVTFDFPKRSFFTKGKVKLVHLGCNMSCNHVNWVVKHGKRLVAKSSHWFKANYLPILYTGIDAYAKKQLRRHGKLVVHARVCVHPPGPQNFCKSHRVILRK